MLERQMTLLTAELLKIDASLRRLRTGSGEPGKVERRIGRWQGKYSAAAKLLEVLVVKDEDGRAPLPANKLPRVERIGHRLE